MEVFLGEHIENIIYPDQSELGAGARNTQPHASFITLEIVATGVFLWHIGHGGTKRWQNREVNQEHGYDCALRCWMPWMPSWVMNHWWNIPQPFFFAEILPGRRGTTAMGWDTLHESWPWPRKFSMRIYGDFPAST